MIKTTLDKIGQVEGFRNERGIIYIIKNKINSKKYIGQSVNSFIDRYGYGFNTHNKHLNRSIDKYGLENFEVLLCVTGIEDIDLLNQIEVELIKEYRTFGYSRKYGYNGTAGGDGVVGLSGKLNHFYGKTHTKKTRKVLSLKATGRQVSDQTRLKMSNSHKGLSLSNSAKQKLSDNRQGENNPFYGRTHSEESKKSMSKNRSGSKNWLYNKGNLISGENNPMYGKTHSEESRKKISEAQYRKSVIIFDGIEIIKNSKKEMVKFMLDEHGVPVHKWFCKTGIAKKYQSRVSYCGYYEDYIKVKEVA